ncbi:MAG: adenylate/guanylate cyclase domain-containing protein [Candidatus Gastranaerophilales bacterium]|nr:adenylate/guanylate cyclase domain-containing protein [Candidatus Gastranaerophilales bacterium]
MRKNVLIICAIVIFTVVVGHFLSNTYLFKHLELMSYDIRSKLNTDSQHTNKDIVIVAIDNTSHEELLKSSKENSGRQTWEKNVWRRVVDFIEEGHPRVLMLDMVFENLNDEPWYNRSFADRIKRYDNIILGTYLDAPLIKDNNFTKKIELEPNDFLPTAHPLDVVIDDKKLDDAITYTMNSPVNDYYINHNIMGVVNSVLDDDSMIRKNQPIFKLVKDGETYYMPSLAFAGFMKVMGDESRIIIRKNKIYYKDRVIPIDNNGIVNVNWHSLGQTYSYVPISKILLNKRGENDLKPEFFKDKMVIIGQTATGGNLDLKSIISSSYSMPEANAIALDNFLNDTSPNNKTAAKFIKEIPKPVQVAITVFACIIVAIVGLVSKSAVIGCLNGCLSILVYIFFCFWLFANPTSRVWLPIVVPLYYLTVTSGIIFSFRFYREVKKKTSIMNVFGKFVSPKVLTSVLKDSDKMVLKNTKKRITVLFCDVKDFSTLSERYEPEKLIENLNELFKEIVNIIFENNGTVDKFIGDCIMAYWGDFTTSDDDAFLAVKTALEIKRKVNELKIKNAKENKIIFDVKIGINTGEAILGLTGTDKIMNYTAMGDAVNIAARLESSCRKLDRDILISKSTYERSKDKIVALEIGKIRVKGKEERIEVYEPVKFVDETVKIIGTDRENKNHTVIRG